MSEPIREALLLQLLKRHDGDTIVYSTTQGDAESVSRWLKTNHIKSAFYHAGMKPEERSKIQDWFMVEEKGQKVVCATIAFGMVDISFNVAVLC